MKNKMLWTWIHLITETRHMTSDEHMSECLLTAVITHQRRRKKPIDHSRQTNPSAVGTKMSCHGDLFCSSEQRSIFRKRQFPYSLANAPKRSLLISQLCLGRRSSTFPTIEVTDRTTLPIWNLLRVHSI